MEKIKVNLNTIFVVTIAILAFLLLKQCNKVQDLKLENKVGVQNIIALNDSIRIVKNKWDEEITLKNTYITSGKELENINKNLSDKIKKLEGDVLYASNIISSIKTDTIFIENEVIRYPDGTNQLSWSYNKDYGNGNSRFLDGNSRFSIDLSDSTFSILDKGTSITRDITNLSILTGLTELDESYQIFVKTDYPGITFSNIEGAILDKKRFLKQTQPNWIFGPSIYIGVGVDPKNATAGPQIGLGISATFNLNKYLNNIFK
jgi:hypothetical protein